MAFETGQSTDIRGDRNVGTIYDRLDAARERREQALETPSPANDDRKTSRTVASMRAFPKLKPPRPDMPGVIGERSWAWTAPWIVALVILVVIVAFALG